MSWQLSKNLSMGPIHLRVRDLEREAGFYQEQLGMALLTVRGRERWLGVDDRPLVVLKGDPKASAKPARTTGLYHYALLHPNRAALGRSLQRLLEAEVQLQGGADHLVSEAIYLPDPEGNGIELYRDRPPEDWPYQDGQLQMATNPLDWDGVLAASEAAQSGNGMAAETVMGHVHLHVANLAEAEAFYGELLGFDLVLRYGQAASFFSVAGYHHHLAVNTWAGVGAAQPPAEAAGLMYFTMLLESANELGRLADRLKEHEVEHQVEPGAIVVSDPSSNKIRIMREENNRAPGEE